LQPFWGKRTSDGRAHPVIDHCLDVAIVFRGLPDLPNLARQLAAMPDVAKDRLAVIAFCTTSVSATVASRPRTIPMLGIRQGM